MSFCIKKKAINQACVNTSYSHIGAFCYWTAIIELQENALYYVAYKRKTSWLCGLIGKGVYWYLLIAILFVR